MGTSLLLVAWFLAASAPAADINPALDKKPILSGVPVRVTRPQAYKWANVVTGAGGLATGFAVHPKDAGVLYVRTAVSGVFRRDFGQHKWVPLCDSFTLAEAGLYSIESIALDANDPNVVYIAAGRPGGTCDILKSTDRGGGWKRLKLRNAKGDPVVMDGRIQGGGPGKRLAVDPNNGKVVYYGSRRDGLLRSTDGGEKWAEVEAFPNRGKEGAGIVFVVFDGRQKWGGEGSAVIYVGVAGDAKDPKRPSGVYRSKDAGETWELLKGGPPADASVTQGKLGPDGSLYVVARRNLWRLRDDKWQSLLNGAWAVAVCPKNPKLLAAHDGTVAFRVSKDDGETWANLDPASRRSDRKSEVRRPPWMTCAADGPPMDTASDLVMDPQDPKKVWLGTGLGPFSCADVTSEALEWAMEYEGYEAESFPAAISPPAGPALISAFFRHATLTVAPSEVLGSQEGTAVLRPSALDFCEVRPETMACVDALGVRFSPDGGATWGRLQIRQECRSHPAVIAIAADTPQNAVLACTGRDGRLDWTKDGGAKWQPARGAPELNANLALASDRAKPYTFYIYNSADGRFYRSDDGGESWKHVSTLPKLSDTPCASRHIAAAPGMPGEVWVALDEQGLFRSSDGGNSWRILTGVTRAHAFGFGKGPDNAKVPTVYLMGEVTGANTDQASLFRSRDLGQTWTRITDDRHAFGNCSYVVGDRQVPDRVFVVTAGRGIFYGEPDPKKQAEIDAKEEQEKGEPIPKELE